MIKFHIQLLRFLRDKKTWVNASSFLVNFYKDDEPLKGRVYQVIKDSVTAGYIELSDYDPDELEKFFNRAGTTEGLLNLRIKIAGEHELDRLEKISDEEAIRNSVRLTNKFTRINVIMGLLFLLSGTTIQFFNYRVNDKANQLQQEKRLEDSLKQSQYTGQSSLTIQADDLIIQELSAKLNADSVSKTSHPDTPHIH